MTASAMATLRNVNNLSFSESVKWFCRDTASAMRNHAVSAVPAQNCALWVPSAERSAGRAAALPIRWTSLTLSAYSVDTSGGGPAGRNVDPFGMTNVRILPRFGASPGAFAGGVGRHFPTARLPRYG